MFHVTQEFLALMLGVRAVLAHQQPTRQTRTSHVKALTARRQRLLVQPHQQAGLDHLAQHRAGGTRVAQGIGFDAPAESWSLHQGAPRRWGQTQHQLGPQHRLAPRHPHLQPRVGVHIDRQRDETGARKVGVAERLAAHTEHV